MTQSQKEIKRKYFEKKFREAPTIKCECGCGLDIKSVDLYGRKKRFENGHNGRKYENPTEHKRAWNRRNPKVRYEAKKKRWRMLKVKLVTQHGGKCSRCGLLYTGKNAAVFHFHHRDPSTKLFALGNQLVNKSWSTIQEEAAKCDMICANCHEMSHSAEF